MKVSSIIQSAEEKLKSLFAQIDERALFNQEKVLAAFREERVAMRHFLQSNGYGYGDEGRDALARVFARALGAEAAIVSPALLSGTHTINVALFGVLRPNDRALIITGTPYDTIRQVLWGEGNGSFKDFQICFDTVELNEGKVDYPAVEKALKKGDYKMVYIQRSRGYELRDSFSIDEIKKMCSFVREKGFQGIIFCDNCYGEFVENKEPLEVGCDYMAGSLIKNPGGGLAPTGGYIAGSKEILHLVEGRLTAPSVGAEVGSYAYGYRLYYQGLFMAPHTVAQILKGGLLIGACLESLGYETYPKANKVPEDITRAVRFDTEKQLTDFIVSVQECSPVDSFVRPEAWDMPGYEEKVIMAAGTFVAGATSELSADAPIRKPYVAYFQGGLTYEHCKLACKKILEKLV